jgi:hypothetical protein
MPKLILDSFCELGPLLRSYAAEEFWDLKTHEIRSDAIYLVGRRQFMDNIDLIRQVTINGQARFILSNPHEGSDTLRRHIFMYGVENLMMQHKILIIGGGDMDDAWPCLRFDSFLPKILDYNENRAAMSRSHEIYDRKQKPFKFLFLNGRARSHRRWLISRWLASEFINHSLWSNLDGAGLPVQLLPCEYEVDRYQSHMYQTADTGYVKFDLFNNEWGEIYLNPRAYIDTYFSVVTETVHDYPYSFRTEKIWKPIVMGHPWIPVANRGFLRDIQNLGFRTFGHLLDETFDLIDDNHQRLQRVAEIVEDLCEQDLVSFLDAAQETCKYNQQHYIQCRDNTRSEFPERFFQFLKQYQWMT